MKINNSHFENRNTQTIFDMSKIIKLKKGLDIKLIGEATKNTDLSVQVSNFAIKPDDFPFVIPKLHVKEGDKVKSGTPLFIDKNNPEVAFVSPASGEILEIKRGDKRKILEIIVKSDNLNESEVCDNTQLLQSDKNTMISTLQKAGLWPLLRQRPYGTIANGSSTPKAVFISTFDTAPLAPDYEYILKEELDVFQAGIDVLAILAPTVHVNIGNKHESSIFRNVKNVQINQFSGPHPAGNVGVQIHHINPINKGEIIWFINPSDVVILGRFAKKGIIDFTKTIAITGSEVKNPRYVKIKIGANISGLTELNNATTKVRHISGNVLTGIKISSDGYLSFYHNQLTVIPEGDTYEFFGWLTLGLKKFSTSRSYFSWLNPKRQYKLDTNIHGEHRAFVVSGQFEQVLPMDIYPLQLLKSIIAEDIEQMENLGIYEITEEDFALCEFVDTSKNDIQEIVRKGIELMVKEMN